MLLISICLLALCMRKPPASFAQVTHQAMESVVETARTSQTHSPTLGNDTTGSYKLANQFNEPLNSQPGVSPTVVSESVESQSVESQPVETQSVESQLVEPQPLVFDSPPLQPGAAASDEMILDEAAIDLTPPALNWDEPAESNETGNDSGVSEFPDMDVETADYESLIPQGGQVSALPDLATTSFQEEGSGARDFAPGSIEIGPPEFTQDPDDSLPGPPVEPGQFVDNSFQPIQTTPQTAPQNAHQSTAESPSAREASLWWNQYIHVKQFPDRVAQRIDLNTAIFMALQTAPQIQVINTEPQIQQTFVNESVGEFDWTTFVETRWNELSQPVDSSLTATGVNRFEEQEWEFEGGVRRRLRSGGDIRVGQNFGTRDNNSTFLTPPDQGTSRLVLDYRQPLLRGAGRQIGESQIVIANFDLQAAENNAFSEMQDYLVDVVDTYWALYEARVQLIQLRRSFDRANELWQQLKSREDVDVTKDQLIRAEAAATARWSAVIEANYNILNVQDRLINLLSGPESREADQIELMPEMIPLDAGNQLPTPELIEIAIQSRPEVNSAIAQIRSASVQEQIATNELLPQLDAVISSQISGLRGNEDVAGAFGDQFTGGDPSYSVGMSFEIPIGNRVARSRSFRSRLQTFQLTKEFEKTVGDVVLDVRVANRNVTQLVEQITNDKLALERAHQELEYIQQRRELAVEEKTGSFFIEDLINSQARLTFAEQRLLANQIRHAVSLVELKRAIGQLIASEVEPAYR